MRVLLAVIALALMPTAFGQEVLRIGTWNLAGLHHESGVALRPDAVARSDEDFARMAEFAASLDLDVVALQEIGSPSALARVFSEADYHFILAGDYFPGAENAIAEERRGYTAFALRKSAFAETPRVETLDALALVHLGVAADRPVIRRTSAGLVLALSASMGPLELLNLDLQQGCNANSLLPVIDARPDGVTNLNRFDCRTLLAQVSVLENWIEQRQHEGVAVLMMGTFNRHMNRSAGGDHLWEGINEGAPGGAEFLGKAPEGFDLTCWPAPHAAHARDHIDYIVFETILAARIGEVTKVGIPFETHPDYQGADNRKLSNHCPVVTELRME